MALYGVPVSSLENRYHSRKKNFKIEETILHRASQKSYHRYSYLTLGPVAKCNGRTNITTGKWSFRAESNWTPGIAKTDEEHALAFLAGKMVPMWAYQAKPCSKCFPTEYQNHTCECGHIHGVRTGYV